MKKLLLLSAVLTTSGCSLLSPNVGTHYEVEYDGIKVKVADYTDREGIEFEYTTADGTEVKLKKSLVNTTDPADVIIKASADNQAATLELLNKVIK